MENQIDIKLVKHGIANNFGSWVEMNYHLLKYPDLASKFIRHEMAHTNKTFSWYDLKHDLKPSRVPIFQLIKFMFLHPKSLAQLLPFYYSPVKKEWAIDINMCIVYFVTIVLIALAVMIIW